MLNIKGVHHICLTVKDPKKSKEFYIKACGMTVWHEDEKSVGLSGCGLDTFFLSFPRDYTPKDFKFDRNQAGLDHFSFYVEDMKDLKEIEKHLKKEGIEMEDGGITDDDYGGTAIFIYDPDGMKVEFHYMPKE